MLSLVVVVLVAVTYRPTLAATVTFRVQPDSVPDHAQVFVTGNHAFLGEWNPGRTALVRQSDGSWQRTFSFPLGTFLEYKVTLGSWDREALAPDGSVPANSTHTVTGDTTLVTRVHGWRAGRRIQGGITGTVHTHGAMEGEGILPRDVHVWLPPGYGESDQRYPVLYLHDGQQVFDPSTSSFGVDWQVDEVATDLIAHGALQPLIVVAVNNTEDRYEEYSDCAKGAAYRRFLIETLKPFVDRTYRTLPAREHTAVMGSSMGGLASFLLAWYHPETFSAAACLSPAFFHHDLNKASAGPAPSSPVRLYLDNGGVGLERRLQAGCDRMLEILQRNGMTLRGDLVWFQDPAAAHNEAAWAGRVWRPLRFLFGSGDQQWIRDLPPPPRPLYESRDREPVRESRCGRRWAVGFKRSVGLHHWDERFPAILDGVENLLPSQDPSRACLLVLSGPDEGSLLDVLVGVEVDSAATVPEGMTRVEIPAAWCRIMTHHGTVATLAESLDYLYTWWLTGSGARLVGPVVVRWGQAHPDSVALYAPVRVVGVDAQGPPR